MKRFLACLAAILFPLSAVAIPFDFTTLGSNNTLLGNTVNAGGVKAEGLVFGPGGQVLTPLWLRNQDDDHGLGVCSEGESACASGGGDVNEISDQQNFEGIRLTLPSNSKWTELWVSSLDSGGTNNNESGILLWGSDPTFGTIGGVFQFSFANFNPDVEGDLLSLNPPGFDPTAPYLLFINDFTNGSLGEGANNDYLLWKGAYTSTLREAPEPGTYLLLAIAFAGLMFSRRRIAI